MKTSRMTVFATAALCAVAFAGRVSAQFKPPAGYEDKAEYSADQTMEMEEMKFTAKIFHTPKKERREQSMMGHTSINIIRQDKQLVWVLMPMQNSYMEHPIGQAGPKEQEDFSQYKVEFEKAGEENVDGHDCAKMKVIATKPDGTKFGGFWWSRKADNIMVKADMIAKMEDGKKRRMLIRNQNIKTGPQDPALFEIPAGYNKMNMGSFMGAGTGASGMGRPGPGGRAPAGGGAPGMPAGMPDMSDQKAMQEWAEKMKKQYGAPSE